MQKNTILVLAIVLCTPQVGYAHDVASDQYAHEELIADLNAIAAIFSPDDITNHTVISVSSVTCATMRTAIREQFAQRIGPILRERSISRRH